MKRSMSSSNDTHIVDLAGVSILPLFNTRPILTSSSTREKISTTHDLRQTPSGHLQTWENAISVADFCGTVSPGSNTATGASERMRIQRLRGSLGVALTPTGRVVQSHRKGQNTGSTGHLAAAILMRCANAPGVGGSVKLS